jgi:dTDP-4-amino-4,6-dideoxygalactose transaminase
VIKFLDLHRQYRSIKSNIDSAIQNVIQSSAFIGGEELLKFEAAFAAYQQAEFCVGVGNGTDAIEIALEALNLPAGSEIIVPANSFIATSEAVTRSGHRVVFADIKLDTYTLDPLCVEKLIGPKTSAIIAVHLYGHPCDMHALMHIARKNNLRVIEDCAQAHGAEYKGQRVGAIGDIGTFSFYPGKNLGAYGDGGAITTNNKILEKKCRMISNHGRIDKYNHQFEGRNSRLDGIQAAILNVKLKHLDSWINHRNLLANVYISELTGLSGVTLPQVDPKVRHAFHLFVIRTNERDDLARYLDSSEIQTGIHYPIALPKLSAYEYLSAATNTPIANQYDQQLLSLPIGEHLTVDDVRFVCSKINEYYL